MIEIPSEALTEIWEMMSDGVSSSKKNELAMRFVKVFLDHEVELEDLSQMKGEDEHLDHALEQYEEEEDLGDFPDEDLYED